MKFKVGDTARLKSGGPVMTVLIVSVKANVERMENDEQVKCAWFTCSVVSHGIFPSAALRACGGDGGPVTPTPDTRVSLADALPPDALTPTEGTP